MGVYIYKKISLSVYPERGSWSQRGRYEFAWRFQSRTWSCPPCLPIFYYFIQWPNYIVILLFQIILLSYHFIIVRFNGQIILLSYILLFYHGTYIPQHINTIGVVFNGKIILLSDYYFF